MELDRIYELARELEAEGASTYEAVCRQIYDFAEIGGNEIQSSNYLTKMLESIGFKVTMPFGGWDTAFRAEYGSGHDCSFNARSRTK